MKRSELTRKTPLRSVAKLVTRNRPKKKPATRDDIPQMTRLKVKLRADFHCEMCGLDLFNRVDGEMSHRRPRGMGGGSTPDRHSPANILFACHRCHADIESHRTAAYDLGRLLKRHQDPASTPVLIHRHGWVLLGTDGTMAESGWGWVKR